MRFARSLRRKWSGYVSRIKRLTQSYSKYVAVPWRDDAAAPQRVIFCVYHETEELRLRAKVDEFEIATRAAGHDWALFDLTTDLGEQTDLAGKSPEMVARVAEIMRTARYDNDHWKLSAK